MANQKSRRVASIKDRYLTFEIDEEKYGIEILRVKEIIGMQKTIHVPRTPNYVKGVMNLRGLIIPVINLRSKLEMPEIEPQMDTAIIIVMIEDVSVGFIVDRVDEVLGIASENLSQPPRFGSSIDTQFIKNMAQANEHVIMILDLQRIFEADELAGIQKMAEVQNVNALAESQEA